MGTSDNLKHWSAKAGGARLLQHAVTILKSQKMRVCHKVGLFLEMLVLTYEISQPWSAKTNVSELRQLAGLKNHLKRFHNSVTHKVELLQHAVTIRCWLKTRADTAKLVSLTGKTSTLWYDSISKRPLFSGFFLSTPFRGCGKPEGASELFENGKRNRDLRKSAAGNSLSALPGHNGLGSAYPPKTHRQGRRLLACLSALPMGQLVHPTPTG